MRHHDTNSKDLLSEIVLVNGAPYDRCQIGQVVEAIARCKPKVIGIDFLFIEPGDPKCDSALMEGITNSRKVVLAEGFEKGIHVESNRLFSENASLSGITGLCENKNGITDSYLRVTDIDGKWVFSFPFQLALQYDSVRAKELITKSPHRPYPIKLNHGVKDFKVVSDLREISESCNSISGKIVIIGFLGPGREDLFDTISEGNVKQETFGAIIMANIVLDILNDLEKE